jgi:adenylate cyclase
LSEHEKTTLRAASIVGRLFRAQWLTGYYPELGSFLQVKTALDALEALDITPLDSPEPELAYLFKHIVTHEVTYESLPFATRARLHEQLAVYLESVVGATRESPLLDTIAFHYLRSENQEKQIEYLRKAGEASQKNFANDAALEYYGSLLPLLKDDQEKHQIHLKRGEVLERIGKLDDAESDYRAALDSAKDDMALKAGVQYALGKLNRQRGNYEPALEWLRQAKTARATLEDTAGLAQVLIETGMVLYRKGEHELAREPLNEGLALAKEINDKLNTAQALNNLGNVAEKQGDFTAARGMYEESLALNREMGDKWGIAGSLHNLGVVAVVTGDYTAARALSEESLALNREMGYKRGILLSLLTPGIMALNQGDYTLAQALYEESGALSREMGAKEGIAASLYYLGLVAYTQGDYTAARVLQEESLALFKEMDDKSDMAYCLLSLGLIDLAENKPEVRENILGSLRLRVETGEQLYQTSSLIGAAGLVFGEGNPQFAAGLLGAVESALKGLNAVVETEIKFFYEGTLVQVKEALGEAAFQSAWEEGSHWSLVEAVKKVLGDKS